MDTDARRDQAGRKDLAAGECAGGTGPGDPRLPALPAGRPDGRAGRGALPLLRRARLRLRPGGSARHRQLRGHHSRRVHPAGAAGRLRRDRLAGRPAVVRRARRHDRYLLGRLQQPPGRGPAPGRPAGGPHLVRQRRPVHRRRSLPGRLPARRRHAAVGGLDADLERPAARPGGRRPRLARAVAGAADPDARIPRAMDVAPAPGRLLAPRVGGRGLLRDRGTGLRGRRLVRRLHRCHPAPAGRPGRAAQGPDRPVVTRVPERLRARARDRVPRRGAAVVGPLAQGDRHRDHGRADAPGLDAGVHAARAAPPALAGALGGRAVLAAGRPPPAPAPGGSTSVPTGTARCPAAPATGNSARTGASRPPDSMPGRSPPTGASGTGRGTSAAKTAARSASPHRRSRSRSRSSAIRGCG